MPDKKYKYVSFMTSPELEAALKKAAATQERSVSWIIKKAITKYLNIPGNPKSKPASH
jgi:predicted transcriptional regulator